jgi:2-amino-4-hydroxy-6-hydroxymethyldihydropteridine diphosphokinase
LNVTKDVYLGFGSNIGDREAQIRRAIELLDSEELRLVRVSSFYETEPIGFTKQRWFLNCVAEFATTQLFPRQLLHRIHRVELQLGRRRAVVNGPRTIDIDILLFGEAALKTPELEVPHPRFRERRFVLAPLVELNPELRDPVTRRSVSDLLQEVKGQAVRRLEAEKNG